jgi:hypothetical protein
MPVELTISDRYGLSSAAPEGMFKRPCRRSSSSSSNATQGCTYQQEKIVSLSAYYLSKHSFVIGGVVR